MGLNSCKEGLRYNVGSEDSTPPGSPSIKSWKPLYGGARFYYTLPKDEDLLSVDAEYTNNEGRTFRFSASFYRDSLDVYGFGDTAIHMVKLYGVDRAGNRSVPIEQKVKPLEPTISRVIKNVKVKPGFSSFLVDWNNELEQLINVYINFKYTHNGENRDIVTVFSSNKKVDRQFVNDLPLSPKDPIEISIRVEDQYGNSSKNTSFGTIHLFEDNKLDKSKWVTPLANDSTVTIRGKVINTGEPAMFGDNLEGRLAKLFDDIIDRGDNLNFYHTGGRGRTGFSKDGNMPYNIIIDLGDYYELSRIVTVQRHSGGMDNISRGQYYRSENVGEFRLYFFNEETEQWEPTTKEPQRTLVPQGVNELQYVRLGEAGDMAYFYPEEPKYTPRTRWFRYEALHCFDDNYSSTNANCMSELSIYGKKANP